MDWPPRAEPAAGPTSSAGAHSKGEAGDQGEASQLPDRLTMIVLIVVSLAQDEVLSRLASHLNWDGEKGVQLAAERLAPSPSPCRLRFEPTEANFGAANELRAPAPAPALVGTGDCGRLIVLLILLFFFIDSDDSRAMGAPWRLPAAAVTGAAPCWRRACRRNKLTGRLNQGAA